jgi:hypothetical protein
VLGADGPSAGAVLSAAGAAVAALATKNLADRVVPVGSRTVKAVWAFSDESERAGVMLLSVVLISPGDLAAARVQLSGLLLRGQRRVHTSDESDRRRKLVIDAVARTEGMSAVVVRYRRPAGLGRVAARHLLLQAATGLVVGSGATAWALDNQDPAQVVRDRASIAHALEGVDRRLHPSYDHRPASSEPMLWAADATCWAAGAGGDWQRRLGGVVTVRDIGP